MRLEAAAKAAEIETELKYLKPLQEREADLTRMKLEKELNVAKARLQAVSEADRMEDYGSLLADLPTDVDRVQQYRTDNAITPPPEPTVTTTFQQLVPTAAMTSANLTNPTHFAATQFPT